MFVFPVVINKWIYIKFHFPMGVMSWNYKNHSDEVYGLKFSEVISLVKIFI